MSSVNKSSRHSKISGDFGEYLTLYWLSKKGFECAHVDHVGLDLVARNPQTDELMGISVKTRTRSVGKEKEHMNIANHNFPKLYKACKTFKCKPYFSIVTDQGPSIRVYILSAQKLEDLFPQLKCGHSIWKMGDKYIDQYEKDKDIYSFSFDVTQGNWWTE